MNFPFYIARRYLVAKKSHNLINIIAAISVTGVAVGAMALIIVLSVFNGFDKLVVSLFSSFNPPVQITAARGKTFDISTVPVAKLKAIPGVTAITEVIEEDALLKYLDQQCIVTLKGVSAGISQTSGIDTMIVEGHFLLEDGDRDFAIPGAGVAAMLGVNLKDYLNPVSVFVPRRDVTFSGGLEQAFNADVIFPSGVFQVQWDYDVKYVLMPLRYVQRIMEYENLRTSLEIGIAPGVEQDDIKNAVAALLGNNFTVKNRYQQQEILYQIMVSEKNYIFMILTLILVIATFNVIGTLSMLILDKKKDIAILESLGAGKRSIRKIFMAEGMLISFTGALSGLALGALLCWLQISFGFVRLGSADSSFVVSAYPVHMQASDFLLVFLTVMVTGILATLYPVLNIGRVETGLAKTE